MVFISIVMILLLIGVTLWLWRLSQAQLIHFAVSMTESSMTVDRSGSKRSFSRLIEVASLLWLRHLGDWLMLRRSASLTLKTADGKLSLQNITSQNAAELAQYLTQDLAKRKRIDSRSEQRKSVIEASKYNISDLTFNGAVQVGDENRQDNRDRAGQPELAQALNTLTQAVLASHDLPEDKKEEQVKVINQIGKEAADPKPNKTLLKILVDGLLTTLKAAPDMASAVTADMPILSQLLDLVTQPDFPPASNEGQIQGGEQQGIRSTETRVPTPLMARYSGTASLPKEVYQNTSQNISLILDRKSLTQGLHCETFTLEDGVAGEQVTLDIQEKDNREQFLEVQLLAAGFSTKGEEKQRQSLFQERLEYRWNCCFQNEGDQQFSLVLKIIHSSGERSLGAIEQTVQVKHVDHFSQQQVRIAAIGTGTVALLATIANSLSTVLGIWHLH